ncbi:YhcH/YjgK/YiaL family protein [Shewanella sp. NIFS-20-20]|uniref:YhcH/YjgK/YiaL family protein n=1 Tax=Shewanella sp. NIFS-20-20 TaxID=2853806 RepID=UPI001C47C3CE|nr:YhcH/YjgK/YiaL family protein [Shewanella sp. NIFS-20-20]MBV7315289.1 YhcH/YjgK/YiaL family protein [Shewanella sp. NIFS-20-20]
MITDTLAMSHLYHGIHPNLAQAFAFLQQADVANLAKGRHDIDGDKVFAIVNDYQPGDRHQSPFEVHQRYMDVQFVVSGQEMCGCLPLADRRSDTDYHQGRDFAEFSSAPLLAQANFFSLKAGEFAIFLPTDIHMPGVGPGSEWVRKVVVKVAI